MALKVRQAPGPISKIKCHVVAHDHKWRPLRNFVKAVISHPLPGLVERFTGAFTAEQMFVETSHELLCGCVIR